MDINNMTVAELRSIARDRRVATGIEIAMANKAQLLTWLGTDNLPLNAATVQAAVRAAEPSPSVPNGQNAWGDQLAAAIAGIAAATRPATISDDVRAEMSALANRLDAVEAAAKNTVVHEVHGPRGEVKIEGAINPAFGDVLALTAAGLPVLMVGPAGTGKTHLAGQIAQALKLPFGFVSLSAGVSEAKIVGSTQIVDGGKTEFVPGQFAKIYENGGVFLFDEIDNADANMLVFLNAALANGRLSIPGSGGRVIARHPDCHILAAANTFGTGPNAQYTGRNRLDASTLDRFCVSTVRVDYDSAVERAIAEGIAGDKGEEVLTAVADIRAAIALHGFRRIASTRLVDSMSRMVAAGWTVEKCLSSYYASWTRDELAKIGRE